MEEKTGRAGEALTLLGLNQVVPEVYHDLLHPAAEELGKNIHLVAKAVTAALSPLAIAIWGFDQGKAWLERFLTARFSRTPPENVIPPRPEIAGPLLMHLLFLKDEETLRELFASLLASAMDRSTAGNVHPAYVHVLQQLTPDEARILTCLGRDPTWSVSDEWPPTGRPEIEHQFEELGQRAGVQFAELSSTYLDNLIRLRVLVCDSHSTAKLEPEGGNERGDWGAYIREGTQRELYLSQFGKRLIGTICHRNSDPTSE